MSELIALCRELACKAPNFPASWVLPRHRFKNLYLEIGNTAPVREHKVVWVTPEEYVRFNPAWLPKSVMVMGVRVDCCDPGVNTPEFPEHPRTLLAELEKEQKDGA